MTWTKVNIIALIIGVFIKIHSQSLNGAAVIPNVAPSPLNNLITEEKVELGKKLFFDKRLSSTGEISCHSCHNLTQNKSNKVLSGTDNNNLSTGINGLKGERNAPTVWNSGLRSNLFWDGRAKSLEDQAIQPFINPVEMGMPDHSAVVRKIEGIKGYIKEFNKVFGDERKRTNQIKGITIEEIGKAIAAFERTLTTPNSKFDLFSKGNKNALNQNAKNGWKTFRTRGCLGCHGSPTFTSKETYIKFPNRHVLSKDYDYIFGFTKDKGRFNVTGKWKDINTWRVPSLRNVEITYPYFHNGAINELREAVRIMGKTQLGITLDEKEVNDITEFLKSLTGKRKEIEEPRLP